MHDDVPACRARDPGPVVLTAERARLLLLRETPGGIDSRLVVFVHSSSGSAGGFRRLVPLLAAADRYVAFEALGAGSEDRCSVRAVAEDYWALISEHLGPEQTGELVLVGWSFGGLVAVHLAGLAERAGHRSVRIVLLDAATPEVLADRPVRSVASLFGLDDLDEGPGVADDALAARIAQRLDADADTDADGGAVTEADVRPFILAHRWHVRALEAPWRPPPTFAHVVLIRARDEPGWAGAPPDLGWTAALGRPVEVRDTPGTHASLLSFGPVEQLADLLNEEEGLPLGSGQARLWFLWLLEPGGTRYTTQFGWRIPASPGEVEAAWRQVCARHPVLRGTYRPDPRGQPRRFATPSPAPVRHVEIPGAEPVVEVTRVAQADLAKPFDLPTSSVRAIIVSGDDAGAWLLVSCHHIAVDGWCLGIVERDLRLALTGPAVLPPPPPAGYQAFVTWEREVRRRPGFPAELAACVQALDGVEMRPPPPDALDDAEPGASVVRFRVDQPIMAGIAPAGVTPFAIVLTCVVLALREWAGTAGVALGVNLANRPTYELEEVVGLFVDPVALWLTPPAGGSYKTALDHVWDRLADAFERSDVPYQDVVTASGVAGRDPWSALFWVIVNYNQQPARPEGEVPWRPLPPVVPLDAKFPFAVLLEHDETGLSVELLYPRDRYRPSTVESVRRRVEQLLDGLASGGSAAPVPAPSSRRPSAAGFADRFRAAHPASTPTAGHPARSGRKKEIPR